MFNAALTRAKDAALERAILLLLGPKLSRYGEVQQLTLDTSGRRLSAVLLLQGDPSPLIISEARYDIQREGEDAFLVFHDVKASRQWVQNLFEDHLHRFPLKLPDFVRRLLE